MNSLGMIYFTMGKVQPAIELLSRATQLDSTFHLAHNNLCSIFGELKAHQKSVDCFKDIIKEHPKDVYAYYNLGITYVEMGKKDKALEIWKKGVAIDSTFHTLNKTYKKLKDRKE